MALTLTVTANYTFPAGRPITLAGLRKAASPSVSSTGSVNAGDIAAGAVTAAKSTPDAYWYAAATGTDTYAATLNPALSALANGVRVRIKFTNANTSTAPTLNVDAVGAKVIYRRGGGALRAGDIAANSIISFSYNTSLNSGAGGWEMEDERPEGAVIASGRNLLARNNTAAPDTTVDVSADELVLKTTGGLVFQAASVSVSILITTAGANGLDTGSRAISTWYYVWVIYNPTTATVAGLFSTSSTAPTMPSGYTFKALVGVARTDAIGSGNFVRFHQRDRRIWCAAQAVLTAKAAAVNDTWEILAGGDITAFRAAVPPIAASCDGIIGSDNITDNLQASLSAVLPDGTLSTALVGRKQFGIQNLGATVDGFAACTSFSELPVAGGTSAYNIQWKSRVTTETVSLSITGYTI